MSDIIKDAESMVKETDQQYIIRMARTKDISNAVRDMYNGFRDVGFDDAQAYELTYLQFKSDLALRAGGVLK